MLDTIGSRITYYRKEKGLKQEDLARLLEVSPQAVSKWETDQSCPDISLLVPLSKTLGISTDELLSGQKLLAPAVRLAEGEMSKDIKDMFFKIVVDSKGGDKVKVNLPIPLVQAAMKMGMGLPQVSGNNTFKDIDFNELISLVEQGVVGHLVEVVSSDGHIVNIFVE